MLSTHNGNMKIKTDQSIQQLLLKVFFSQYQNQISNMVLEKIRNSFSNEILFFIEMKHQVCYLKLTPDGTCPILILLES